MDITACLFASPQRVCMGLGMLPTWELLSWASSCRTASTTLQSWCVRTDSCRLSFTAVDFVICGTYKGVNSDIVYSNRAATASRKSNRAATARRTCAPVLRWQSQQQQRTSEHMYNFSCILSVQKQEKGKDACQPQGYYGPLTKDDVKVCCGYSTYALPQ